MWKEIKTILKIAFNKVYLGREITILPQDIFIVSYPKSGNTWTRFLIGNVIYLDENLDFISVEKRIPDIYLHTDSALLRIKSPRVLKSHEYFTPRYKRVIYIVRDPRDVLVSYYYHLIKANRFDPNKPIYEFAVEFMAGKFDPYGSWYENVSTWVSARKGSRDFILIRYEDMLTNTQNELQKIVTFLGHERDTGQMNAAIERSSITTMQELEKKQANQWGTTKGTNLNMPFIRSGKSGDWENHLPKEVSNMVESEWGELMRELGYW